VCHVYPNESVNYAQIEHSLSEAN